jgi:hypothetical protein
MKLVVPDGWSGQIVDADGNECEPVNGIVEMADDKTHSALWGFGFVVQPPQPETLAPSRTQSKDETTV